MDIDPGPGCRIYAAIELGMGAADMRIIQSGADQFEELDHLWRRPPFGLLDGCAAGEGETAAELRSLLEGFCRAARDYGVDSAYLFLDGLYAWREALVGMAAELGLCVVTPDWRRRLDMALAAAARRSGGIAERRAFIIPGGAETCVVSDDGRYFFRLPMGMDRGGFRGLLELARKGERRQLRRRDGADMRPLLRDAARACARCLPADGMEQYSLHLCVNFPEGIIAQGDCPARQLAALSGELARRAADAGAGLCYTLEEADACEPYGASCLRRAHNAVCIAEAICARLGAAGVNIVCASARDAVLDALCGPDSEHAAAGLADAGRNAGLARRGAECYAGAHGGSAIQSARVATAARMMLLALSGAFAADELPAAEELIALAAALGDCLSVEPDVLARDAERLPGLSLRAREMLVRICSVERGADNAAVYSALMPERAAEAPDDGALFAGDVLADDAAGDEFAAVEDDYADYGELSGTAYDDEREADNSDAYEYEYDMPAAQANSKPDVNIDAVADMSGHPARVVRARIAECALDTPLELRVAALLRLARALNISGRERLSGLSAKLGGRGLLVRASLRESAVLETLEFKYRAELFERVFGIKARLKLDKRRAAR